MNRGPAGLEPDLKSMVRLSAAIGARWPEPRLEPLAEEAARLVAHVEVEEALLQAYLFVGYPGALRAIGVWRRVVGPAAEGPTETDWQAWEQRGEEVCRRVYGAAYDRLRANIDALNPDLGRWMVVEGYGKVLGRSGLSLDRRELCIVGLLAGQGARDQLYSHLRGALRVGTSARTVEATLAAIADVIGADRHAEAGAVWQSVRERPGE